jgi:hypothetical protein
MQQVYFVTDFRLLAKVRKLSLMDKVPLLTSGPGKHRRSQSRLCARWEAERRAAALSAQSLGAFYIQPQRPCAQQP